MDLISVQCPHCGAALPPREPSGRYRCDYCQMGFRAGESRAAKTQAGVRVSPKDLDRLIRQVESARSPATRTGGGCALAVFFLLAGAGAGAAIWFSGEVADNQAPGRPATAPPMVATPRADEPNLELPGSMVEEVGLGGTEIVVEAPAGMAVSALAQLDPDNDSWNLLQSEGLTGSPRAFDPIENVPWALATARAWAPDARLTRIDIDRVLPTGALDFGARSGVDYRFYSPARRAAELEMAKVSDTPVRTEFRIWIVEGTAKVLQSSRSRPSADAGPPSAVVTCSLKALLRTWRDEHKLPGRPGYGLTMYWVGKRYRWTIDTGRLASPKSMPRLAPDACAEGEPAPAIVPEAVSRTDYQALTPDCGCGEPRVLLSVRVISSGHTITPAGSEVRRELDYMIDVGDESVRLPNTPDTAPPITAAGGYHLAVACHVDHLIVVAGERVTAWSTSKHRLVWNVKLPSAYRPPIEGTELMIGCTRLEARKDTLRVRLANGRSAVVDLRSGTLR